MQLLLCSLIRVHSNNYVEFLSVRYVQLRYVPSFLLSSYTIVADLKH